MREIIKYCRHCGKRLSFDKNGNYCSDKTCHDWLICQLGVDDPKELIQQPDVPQEKL